MKIEITGSRCINCHFYTQYYRICYQGVIEAINCGFCGQRQCTTRPGNRCKSYMEKSNIANFDEVKK